MNEWLLLGLLFGLFYVRALQELGFGGGLATFIITALLLLWIPLLGAIVFLIVALKGLNDVWSARRA